MQFQIIKQELLKVLQLAQDTSERDNINSYYSCFIVSTKDNKLTIKSANRQTSFAQTLESNEYTKLEISENGEYLIPGLKFVNIINSLHDGIIVLKSDDLNLTITEIDAKKSNIKFTLRMRDIIDYPSEIHQVSDKESCKISIERFLQIITNTSFAVSSNLKDTSMFLTGVFLDINEDILTAVATDRNRMSISKIQIDGLSILKNSYDKDVIIPLKSILFIKKILMRFDLEDECKAVIDADRMFFIIGDINISVNLIAGQYYDYKRIIPTENRNRISVNTQQLKETIMRVIVANDNKKENNVLITVNSDSITISAEEQEKTKASESIPVVLEGKEQAFLTKSQFLLDPLQIINSEQIYIDYGDNIRDLIRITSIPEQDTIHIAAQLNK